jgi:hypothetical protein
VNLEGEHFDSQLLAGGLAEELLEVASAVLGCVTFCRVQILGVQRSDM